LPPLYRDFEERMTQAITESFCERCGTRYEFKAPTRLNAMRKTRGLVSGLRNYIMSQDALGDAIDDGIRTEEEALAAHQLDAFHQSFNFCIDCRQYTCLSCWNDDAGRCRSCAPIEGTDDLLRRLEAATALDAAQAAELEDATVELGPESWPSSDLVLAEANGNGPHGLAWPAEELEPIAEAIEELPAAQAEPVAAEAVEAEPVREAEPIAAEAEPEPEPQPFTYALEAEGEVHPFEYALEADAFQYALEQESAVAGDEQPDVEPVAAIVESPVHILAWDDDGAAEPEPEPVAAQAAPEPKPEPVAAQAAPEPEPIPFDRRSYPAISETIMPLPRPAPVPANDRVAAEADSDSLAARRAQLDRLGLDDPGQGAVERSRPNVLPYRSRGALPSPTDLGRRMAAHSGGSFWDASAREVAEAMTHVGVQSCGQCGLSLSASARFCRRCGTQQARSA
jgi:ribosomal protein L40E